MKISVIGIDYIGLATAVLLVCHNRVTGVDLIQSKVDAGNASVSADQSRAREYIQDKALNLISTTDAVARILQNLDENVCG